ncbi:patatin-like phospholipase family protein [Sphingomonas sp. BIUV-7]|uniref:Patatin-like phospholipase family protein n=1 Tax=Sphingomonas natans TaxID=3063330 RepID=A0ABT8Y776_9SPHN|nr:patatin-like phospholipase family protein [Sphingomonas sp. BIUV-7]MDO6414175.1 patatin-like phospholipase family protein [Sphingomonas sp. BIUV-7]
MAIEFARERRDFNFVLILSGGNALGAFQAGAYEALNEAGLEPDWVIGASAGAMNGAIIAGNDPAARLAKLADLWRPRRGRQPLPSRHLGRTIEILRRSAAAHWTMTAGRLGVFGPILSGAGTPAIFETSQMVSNLDTLVDFERLNRGNVRFTATSVDIESGEDVLFDTDRDVLGPQHVRASAALPVAFPPVEIDGRWLADGGLSANLPVDPFFASPPAIPTLCIAIDLLPLAGRRPRTLGDAATRMQDLLFATQSHRSMTRWKDHYQRRQGENLPGISFLRLAYEAPDTEISGKAMDFSPRSVGDRWDAGKAEMERLIDGLGRFALPIRKTGIAMFDGRTQKEMVA